RTTVNERPGTLGGANRVAAWLAQDASEGQVHTLERTEHARRQRRWRIAQRVDELVCALVALAPFAEAAVNDLLQVIAAGQAANIRRADACAGVPLDEHADQLSDLIDVVARLPFRRRPSEDVACRGKQVHGAGGDTAPIALLLDDAEVAELEAAAIANEDVEGREIPMEQLP